MTLDEMLTKAESQTRTAQDKLDAALAAGSADTQPLRLAVERARDKVLELQEQGQAAQVEAEQARQAARQVEAARLAAEARTAIQEEMAALLALPDLIVPEIATAAAELWLKAQEEDADAASAQLAHRVKLEALLARQSALAEQRQSIQNRRLLGDQRPDDGREIELLNLDSAGLDDLIARTRNEEPVASREAEKWVRHWRDEVATARRQAIVRVCLSLETALETSLRRNRADLGNGSAYIPGYPLRAAMRLYGL